jgi:hypothetical protein
MKWLMQGKTIQGISHLNMRFGFNSTILSLSSLLCFFKVDMIDYNTGQNIILIFVLSFLLSEYVKRRSIINLFFLLKILLLTKTITTSPGTDISPALLCLYVFYSLFYQDKKNYSINFTKLTVITFFIVTLKVSYIAMLILPIIYIFINRKNIKVKEVLQGTLIASLLPILWVIQNLIVSGCIIFPIPALCFENTYISWAIGKHNALTMSNVIKGWNRLPGENWHTAIYGWEWLSSWIKRESIQKFLVLSVSTLILSLLSLKTKKKEYFYYFIPFLLLTLFLWVTKAPDMRFVSPHVEILCYLVFINYFIKDRTLPRYTYGITLLIIIYLQISHLTRGNLSYFLYTYKPVTVKTKLHKNGISQTPVNSDQCWNTHLNCTTGTDPAEKSQVLKIMNTK